MTVAALYQALQDRTTTVGGELRLTLTSAESLGSNDVRHLVETWFGRNLEVVFTDPPSVGAAVVYRGTVSFRGTDYPAVADFHLDPLSGAVQLTMTLTAPAGWTFDKAFSALAGSAVAAFPYVEPTFVLTSSTTEALPQGLTFRSGLRACGVLTPVAWLLENLASVTLTGQVTPPATPTAMPVLKLTATGAGSYHVGDYHFDLDVRVVAGTLSNGVPRAAAELGATFGWGEATLKFPLVLELMSEAQTFLQFDLGEERVPIASLSELDGLAGDRPLSDAVPGEVPLPAQLVVSELTLIVSTESERITLARVGVGIEDWQLIPNGILTLSELTLTFSISEPLASPSVSAMLVGVFGVGRPVPFAVDASVMLPDLLVDVGLAPGATLPLGLLIAQMLTAMTGEQVRFPGQAELVVTELEMMADARDKTFTIETDVQIGEGTSRWSLPLIGSLSLDLVGIGFVLSYADGAVTGSLVATVDFGDAAKGNYLALSLLASRLDRGWQFGLTSPQVPRPALTQTPAPGTAIELVSLVEQVLEHPQPLPPRLFPSTLYIENVGFTVILPDDDGPASYTVDGAVVGTWDTAIGSHRLAIAASVHLERTFTDGRPVHHGVIGGEVDISNLKVLATYTFGSDRNELVVMLGKVTADVIDDKTAGQTTLSIAFGDMSVGDVIAFLIGLAERDTGFRLPAPWNILDSVSLHGLTVTANLTGAIHVCYPVNAHLGFITIDTLTLAYSRPSGRPALDISIEGDFFGQKRLSWDALNEPAPTVPGKGSSLFDLRYLGLGQHIAIEGLTGLTTIGAVIDQLVKNALPIDGPGRLSELDGVRFDPNRGWFVGIKAVLMETVTLSLVFNDPNAYGLRIELAGAKSKIFAGLAFEVLYRKVTDTIGVYHVELKLPDAMRQLQLGEVSITLPVVDVDVYTNGDFRVDLGFPTGGDFSRSFCVQVFPFVGYGGCYLALLDGATSNRVPRITNGTWSPVVEFGLGLSLGVGKTVDEGVFSAGLTVTVTGIVEGCLAWFRPTDTSLPEDTYYWLQGTVAIVGKLYGTVDFAVLRANVSVTAYASVTLVIEAYQPIHVALDVGVSVEVTVKIVFFTVHLSFSMRLHAAFTIGSADTPPWRLAGSGTSSAELPEAVRSGGPLLRQQRTAYAPAARFAAVRTYDAVLTLLARLPHEAPLAWEPAIADVATARTVRITAVPMFTRSTAAPLVLLPQVPVPTGASVQYAVMLFIGNAVPPEARTADEVAAAAVTGDSPDFNALAQSVLEWCVRARVGTADVVSAADLAYVQQQLAADGGFDAPALYRFLEQKLCLVVGTTPPGSVSSGTAFPMPPALALATTAGESIDYATDPRVAVGPGWLADVAAYFARFMADVANAEDRLARTGDDEPETGEERAEEPTTAPADGTMSTSVTSVVFHDYFLMLARAVVGAAISRLKSHTHRITPSDGGRTLAALADSFNLVDGAPDPVTPLSIVTANQDQAGLLASAGLTIRSVGYLIRAGDTLAKVAAAFPSDPAHPIRPGAIADTNGTKAGLIVAGATVTLGTVGLVVGGDDETWTSIADVFAGVTPAALQAANPGVTLRSGVRLTVPDAQYLTRPGDTFASVAARFGVTAAAIGELNTTLAGLLTPTATVAMPPITYLPSGTDTPVGLAQAFNLTLEELTDTSLAPQQGLFRTGADIVVPMLPDRGVQSLLDDVCACGDISTVAAMQSRFMLHGLRVPPPYTGSTPPSGGAVLPVTVTTGQQLLAPAPSTAGYAFTLGNPSGVSWIRFADTPGPDRATYTFGADDLNIVSGLAGTRLQPGFAWAPRRVSPLQYLPNRYTAQKLTPWLSADGPGVVLPSGSPATPGPGEPSLWAFPPVLTAALRTAPHGTTPGTVTPPFDLLFGTYVDATSPMRISPLTRFAWATSVPLTVRRVTRRPIEGATGLPVPGTDAMPNTYLVVGTDGTGRGVLAALGAYLDAAGAADPAQVFLAYPPNRAEAASSGLISDELDRTATFVVRTNLTTTTNPASGPVSGQGVLADTTESAAGPAGSYLATFDATGAPTALRMVWEAGTFNSGGYYLHYATTSGAGLPGHLFDDSGEATLTLLMLLDSQKNTPPPAGEPAPVQPGDVTAPPLYAFNTCAVIGEHVDASNANVFVQARCHVVGPMDTLATIAGTHGITVAELAIVNQDVRILLEPGFVVSWGGHSRSVGVGESLAMVAASLPGSTVAGLAAAYAGESGLLLDGAVLQFGAGQLTAHPALPQGSVGYELGVVNPDPADLPFDKLSTDPGAMLGTLFHLVGYELRANDFFDPGELGGIGLPAGPATSAADGSSGLSDPLRKESGGPLPYRQLIPISGFGTVAADNAPAAGLPDPASNPYAGLATGANADLSLAFVDVLGNPTDAAPQPALPPVPVGYTDDLVPLSQWPGLASAYQVSGTPEAPQLTVTLTFAQTQYLPRPGMGMADCRRMAAAHQLRYEQVYFQVTQPDVAFRVASSLLVAPSLVGRQVLVPLVAGAYLYLGQVLAGRPAVAPVAAGARLGDIATDFHTDPGTLAEANADLLVQAVFDLTARPSLVRTDHLLTGHGDPLSTLLTRTGLTIAAFVGAYGGVRLAGDVTLGTSARPMPAPGAARSIAEAAAALRCTVADLATTNQATTGLFVPNRILRAAGATVATEATDSFRSLVTKFETKGVTVTPDAIALANAAEPGLLVDNPLTVTTYVTRDTDTLLTAAAWAGTDAITLATGNTAVAGLYPQGTPFVQNITPFPAGQVCALTIREAAVLMQVHPADLGRDNARHPLMAGALAVPTQLAPADSGWAPYVVPAGVTLSDIAANLGVDTPALVGWNADAWYVLAGNRSVTVGSTTVPVDLGDTFATVLAKFPAGTVTLARLAEAMQDQASYLVTGSVLSTLPPNTGSVPTTLTDLARRLGTDVPTLASVNVATAGLLNSTAGVHVSHPARGADRRTVVLPVRAHETFQTLVDAFAAEQIEVTVGELAAFNADVPGLVAPGVTVVAPMAAPHIAVPLGSVSRQDARFPVTVNLDAERTNPDLVHPDFGDAPAVVRADTLVHPDTDLPYQPPRREGAESAEADTTASLRGFAQRFEAALPSLKIATSPAATSGPGTSPVTIWAVRFATDAGFAYTFEPDPHFFAIRPLAGTLLSPPAVTVQPYESGRGLTPGLSKAFQAVDIEMWARRFLAAVDLFLSPQYAVPAFRIDRTHVDAVIDAKRKIADAIADRLDHVLDVPRGSGDRDEAVAAMRQQLLIALSNAYAIDTVVQYRVDVTASPATDAASAPRLWGSPVNAGYVTGPADYLETVAESASLQVAPGYLATVLADLGGVLSTGTTVSYGEGRASYTIRDGDTLTDVAAGLSASAGHPISVTDLPGRLASTRPGTGLFRAGTPLPLLGVSARVGNNGSASRQLATFRQLADYFNMSVAACAQANELQPGVIGASSIDCTVGGITRRIEVASTDTLLDVAGHASSRMGVAVSVADLATQLASVTGILRTGVTMRAVSFSPDYSMSTASFPLSRAGDGPTSSLTFFLGVRSDASVNRLYLDLDFHVNAFQYDLDAAGTAASWLTFVLPLAGSANSSAPTALGPLTVPVPLRDYPTPPMLISQSAQEAAGIPTLASLPFWDYTYSFQYQEAAQDDLKTTVTFNHDVPPMRYLSADGEPDLFARLAQFAYVAEDLMADLAKLADWAPGGDTSLLRPAISAFATIIGWTADAWQAWVEPPSPTTTFGTAGQSFLYRMVNHRESGEETLDSMTVAFQEASESVTLPAPLPAAAAVQVGGKFVDMSLQGEDHAARQVTFGYPGSTSATASRTQRLAFRDLHVLCQQDAWAGLLMTRNENLLDWPATNPSFVYTTPLVRFANPAQPLVERVGRWDISCLGHDLASALAAAFRQLFRAGTGRHWVKVTAGFAHSISGLTDPGYDLTPTVPICLLPKRLYAPGAGDDGVTADLAGYVTTWLATNASGSDGTVVFEVTVFANVTGPGGDPVAGNPVLVINRLSHPVG